MLGEKRHPMSGGMAHKKTDYKNTSEAMCHDSHPVTARKASK